MAHPLGLPSEQLPDGSWAGTTPQGIQRVLGQMYMNAGIVPGNRTEHRVVGTTGWSYDVPALTAFMWISHSARRGVLVPVEAETIPVSAPVGGASRTDTIYIDLDGVVKVAEGKTSAPAGVEIDRMVIPAGATNTRGAVSNWDIKYAIPTGASLGRLAFWAHPGSGTVKKPVTTQFTKRFYVPSDRLIKLDMGTTLRATGSAGGRAEFLIDIDGGWQRNLACHHDSQWRSYHGSWSTGVSVGEHTVTVKTQGYGTDDWTFNTNNFRTEFSLWDMGADD